MFSNISQNENISLDNICNLNKVTYDTDDIGQQIPKKTERMVFCAELTVYNSESYRAAQQNIRAACILAVDSEEYEGETEVHYEGTLYNVYKIRKCSNGITELYCEVKSNVNI